jgi:hypothetical protein
MKISKLILSLGVAAAATSMTALAHAQNASVTAQGQVTLGNGTPAQALPPSRSDNDAQPMVASPSIPAEGVVQQAGVGGTTAYGRAGVLEVGGSAGLSVAGDLIALRIAPTLGWFFMNNVEISGIVSLNYARTTSNGQTTQATSLNVLVEPSVHLPLNRTLFLFGGLGMGLAYADGPGAGFALAPRLGANVMVGRSGVFTPAVTFVYSTSGAVETAQGTLLSASTSLGINLGYTVMW